MTTIIAIIIIIIAIYNTIKDILSKKLILDSFRSGDVNVSGVKGAGKDMLFNYVINTRKKAYISNVNYTGNKKFNPLTSDIMTLPTTRKELAEGKGCGYVWKYPEGTDIYISDAGILFPSWDYTQLNRDYPTIPLFTALTRHIGDFRIHTNSQSPMRIWDKIREQQDSFIVCLGCKVYLKKYVILKARYYTMAESAAAKLPPAAGKRGEKAVYTGLHGQIKNIKIHFILKKFKYNDRAYKEILAQEKG